MGDAGRRLYKRFRTEQGHYIYDTASNQILRVTPEVWEALDDYLRCYGDPRPRCGRTSIGPLAISQIEEGLSNGLLAPTCIERMSFLGGQEQLREAIATRVPQLTLELTEDCTARCCYCPFVYRSGRTTAPRRMEWATVENALRTFAASSGGAQERAISFWGGEPLLEFETIRRVVLSAHEYGLPAGIHYQVTSNGTLLDDQVAEFLVAHDIILTVSLDGPARLHDRYRVSRSGRPTFGPVMRGLMRLRQRSDDYYRRRVQFECVVTSGAELTTLNDFFAGDALCAGHYVTFNVVATPAPFAKQYGAFTTDDRKALRLFMRSELEASQGRPDRPFAVAAVKSLRPVILRARSPLGSVVHPNGCCLPLMKKMHVTTSGSIHLCERMDDDNSLGNVNEGGVDVERAVRLVQEYCDSAIAECRHCWAVRLCSACYREFVSGGCWHPTHRELACRNSRERVLESLVDYATILERNAGAFDYLRVPASEAASA